MKKLLAILSIGACLSAFGQTHADTLKLLRSTAGLYDLNFSDAEADSMIANIAAWKRIYVNMHKQLPPNDLAYPFAFQPAPAGTSIPVKQQPVNWTLPAPQSRARPSLDAGRAGVARCRWRIRLIPQAGDGLNWTNRSCLAGRSASAR